MKTHRKRKAIILTRKNPLGTDHAGRKIQHEVIDAALNLVVFKKEILKSLQKVAHRGCGEGFLVAKQLIYVQQLQAGVRSDGTNF
jgi:hypothetical protein